METYAFLPREAVTAFLMGCPQCSTNNVSPPAAVDNVFADNTQQVLHPPVQPIFTSGFYYGVSVENWSSSFACSTPVKSDGENYCSSTTDSTAESNRITKTAVTVVAMRANKENVMDNDVDIDTVVSAMDSRNKRKRTVPLRRDIRQKSSYQVVATDNSVVLSNSSTGSSTLRNSSSGTMILSSSSSCRTDNSEGVSKSSSGGWWSKWGMRNRNSMRLSASSDLSGSTGPVQPLDLSSSPLLTISSTPTEVQFDDFFYKRRRVRRRRKPKRLNKSCFGGRHAGDRHDYNDDTSASDLDLQSNSNKTDTKGLYVEDLKTDDEDDHDDGPRPAKIKRVLAMQVVAVDDEATAADMTKTQEDFVESDGIMIGLDELDEHHVSRHY